MGASRAGSAVQEADGVACRKQVKVTAVMQHKHVAERARAIRPRVLSVQLRVVKLKIRWVSSGKTQTAFFLHEVATAAPESALCPVYINRMSGHYRSY